MRSPTDIPRRSNARRWVGGGRAPRRALWPHPNLPPRLQCPAALPLPACAHTHFERQQQRHAWLPLRCLMNPSGAPSAPARPLPLLPSRPKTNPTPPFPTSTPLQLTLDALGANPGTDITDALAQLDSPYTGPGVLFVSRGTYTVSASLHLRKPVAFQAGGVLRVLRGVAGVIAVCVGGWMDGVMFHRRVVPQTCCSTDGAASARVVGMCVCWATW